MTPLALFHLNLQTLTLATEMQTVIALRLMGMSGLIPARVGENSRMVQEKPTAFARSWFAATAAMMQGKSADQVMGAAMRPLSTRVSANRKRLLG